MVTEYPPTIKHSPKPPCACDQCIEATVAADSRRAELAEILDRLEWLELLSESADE